MGVVGSAVVGGGVTGFNTGLEVGEPYLDMKRILEQICKSS